MPVEHYIFERERFTFSMALSKEQFESMKGWELNKYEADFGRQMVYRLTMLMAHGDRTVTATEDVPITWWDHLKLDVNLWALNYIRKPHLFFTNIARAIVHLSITPKFRRIESSILVKRFCPHVGVSDDRSHIEFLMHKPLNYSNFRNGGIDY
jgi:hypothetical protein